MPPDLCAAALLASALMRAITPHFENIQNCIISKARDKNGSGPICPRDLAPRPLAPRMGRVERHAIGSAPMGHHRLVAASIGASVTSGRLLGMVLMAVGSEARRVERITTRPDRLNVVHVGCTGCTT